MGEIIAFSGVDGSGKTTAAKLLVKKLRESGIKVTYRHEFDYLILGPIKELINKLIGIKKSSNFSGYIDSNLEQGSSIQKVIYSLAWLDHIVSYLYFKLKRGIVVSDRWHYDHIAHLEYKQHKSAFLKKLYSFSPRADIIILLDIHPQISYQRRKTDFRHPNWARKLVYYEIQRSLMLKIAHLFYYDKIVNSNKPPNEIVSDIIRFLKESDLKSNRRNIAKHNRVF